MDCGMHASLHVNCHHQIIFAKFNLQVYYPPLYERGIISMQIRIISEKVYVASIG